MAPFPWNYINYLAMRWDARTLVVETHVYYQGEVVDENQGSCWVGVSRSMLYIKWVRLYCDVYRPTTNASLLARHYCL